MYLNNYNFTGTAKLTDTGRNWQAAAISSEGKYQLMGPNWWNSTTATGYVYRSNDYGETWITTAISASGVTPSFATGADWIGASIAKNGKWQVLAAQFDYVSSNSDGCLYISYDYGENWNVLYYGGSFTQWKSVNFSQDGNYILAIANRAPLIFKYNNTGSGLTPPPTPNSWARLVDNKWTVTSPSISGIGAGTDCRGGSISYNGEYMMFAVFNGLIYNSNNFGATWTSRNSSRQWTDTAMSYDGIFQSAIVPIDGQVYTSSNFGSTFVSRSPGGSFGVTPTKVRMSADGRIQVVTITQNLGVCISYNYGSTWSIFSPGISTNTSSLGLNSNAQYLTIGKTSSNLIRYDLFNTGTTLYSNSKSGSIGIYNTNPSGAFTSSRDIFTNNLRLGLGAGQQTGNTVFGFNSLRVNTSGNLNTSIGPSNLIVNTTGSGNIAIGVNTLVSNIGGSFNTAIGFSGCANSNRFLNSSIGYGAKPGASTYFNVTLLGANSTVTGNNQVQLGDTSTTSYAYGAIQNRSDSRDKEEIKNTELGLNFIENIKPVDFKYNYREDYKSEIVTYEEKEITEEIEHITYVEEEIEVMYFDADLQQEVPKKILITKPIVTTEIITKVDYIPIYTTVFDEENYISQTKKRNRYHHGLIAQDLENLNFGGYQDHSFKGGEDVLTVGYEEFIAPLIKSIQEIKQLADECQADIDSLKRS